MKPHSVCGIVIVSGKVLLVRHTYGVAKGRLILPGGYVKEHEMAPDAIEREIYEETKVVTKAKSIISIQFKPDEWCVYFEMEYISGVPSSDNYENSEVVLMTLDEAVSRNDITNTSKAVLEPFKDNKCTRFLESNYCPETSKPDEYKIFGIDNKNL